MAAKGELPSHLLPDQGKLYPTVPSEWNCPHFAIPGFTLNEVDRTNRYLTAQWRTQAGSPVKAEYFFDQWGKADRYRIKTDTTAIILYASHEKGISLNNFLTIHKSQKDETPLVTLSLTSTRIDNPLPPEEGFGGVEYTPPADKNGLVLKRLVLGKQFDYSTNAPVPIIQTTRTAEENHQYFYTISPPLGNNDLHNHMFDPQNVTLINYSLDGLRKKQIEAQFLVNRDELQNMAFSEDSKASWQTILALIHVQLSYQNHDTNTVAVSGEKVISISPMMNTQSREPSPLTAEKPSSTIFSTQVIKEE